jgi:beta-glucosidase-like glycosyl hydrolase
VNGQLISQITRQGQVPLFAESETMFFPKVVDAEIEFPKNTKEHASQLILHQGGRDMTAERLDEAATKSIAMWLPPDGPCARHTGSSGTARLATATAVPAAIVLKCTWHDAFLVDVGTSHAIEWKRKYELRHLITRSSRLKRNGRITGQIKF